MFNLIIDVHWCPLYVQSSLSATNRFTSLFQSGNEKVETMIFMLDRRAIYRYNHGRPTWYSAANETITSPPERVVSTLRVRRLKGTYAKPGTTQTHRSQLTVS